MAGMTSTDHMANDIGYLKRITALVTSTRWQDVMVLTTAGDRSTRAPVHSVKQLVEADYPEFLERLVAKHGAPIQDFWVAERGSASRRPHLNVLLASDRPLSPSGFSGIWSAVGHGTLWHDRYDPTRDVSYWVKDLVRQEADVIAFGGSVLRQAGALPPVKKRRTRRRDYVDHLLRFRHHGVRYP